MTPPGLSEADRKNFQTLLRAAADSNCVLVSAIRKEDQKPVALVCAIEKDGDDYRMTPFAVMVEGNPYELFEDPTVESPGAAPEGREILPSVDHEPQA